METENQAEKKNRPSRALLWGLLLVFVAATVGLTIAYVVARVNQDDGKGGDSTTEGLCTSPSCVLRAGQLLSAIDKSVDPCTDFYQYACGNWMKTHFITEKQAVVSAGIAKIQEDVNRQMKRALEQSNTSDTKVVRLAKTFYRSCHDEEQRKKVGVQPLINLINKLGTWPLTSPGQLSFALDLEDTLAKLARVLVYPLILTYPMKDFYNSSAYILTVSAGNGKSLDSVNNTVTDIPRQLAIHVLNVSDTPALAKDINDVMLFEAKLAAILPTPAERQNIFDYSEKMKLSELQDSNPKFNWTRYLTTFLGPNNVTFTASTILMRITKSAYLNDLMNLYESTDKRTVANFLLMRIVTTYLPYLPKDIRDLEKEKYEAAESKPQWKVCVQDVITDIKEGAGQLYVAKYFSPIAKMKALEVTRDLQDAVKQLIEEAKWLDDATKATAVEKLKAMVVEIGYPAYQFNNTFLDEIYSDVRVVSGNYLQTIINIKEFEMTSYVDLLDNKYKDVIVWDNSAAVTDATYNPIDNAMRFLAAILQPPFFGEDFPMYMLFGSTGLVAGHEFTHGFDTTGSMFDKDGNLRNWWSTESRNKFNELTQCFVDQYSKVVVAGLNVSGLLTLGENIADNGGLKAAYMALERWQNQHGREPQMPGLGLTNEQVFFVSMAQPWCVKKNDATLRALLASDVHSPEFVRVRMIMANSPHFAEAFKCPAGSPMNPVKKCKLW